MNIAEGANSLQDIKIEDAEEYIDNIQILNEWGAMVSQHYYDSTEKGWMDADGAVLATDEIAPGMSVLLETQSSTTITFAGAVSSEGATIETVPGFNFIGNNTPVVISIQDFKIEGAEEYIDNIQILNEWGAMVSQHYYDSTEKGWMDADGAALATDMIEPGQGILIETGTKLTVTLPGVK